MNKISYEMEDLQSTGESMSKSVLNKLLEDNLDRIKGLSPSMGAAIRSAIERNEPEEVFREIYFHATEMETAKGVEVLAKVLAERVYGKELVKVAFELHNKES